MHQTKEAFETKALEKKLVLHKLRVQPVCLRICRQLLVRFTRRLKRMMTSIVTYV